MGVGLDDPTAPWWTLSQDAKRMLMNLGPVFYFFALSTFLATFSGASSFLGHSPADSSVYRRQ